MPESPAFIHLHTHSAFSLAEGAVHPKDLVALCVEAGMPALAITDTNNMFGALEFALAAAENGVQPIIGCQLTLVQGQKIVLLVQNEQGYKNLSHIISDAYMKGEGGHDVVVTQAALTGLTDGLICLSGGTLSGLRTEKDILAFQALFGDRFYIELHRHGRTEESAAESTLLDLADTYNIPLVAANDCYFATPDMHEAHDALLCISAARYVTESDRRKETPQHYFKSPAEMCELFADLPEALQNTVHIAQRCHFLLETIDPILPPFETESGRNEIDELRIQAKEGLKWRIEEFVLPHCHSEQSEESQTGSIRSFAEAQDDKYKEISKPYFERLEYELEIVEKMGFPGYFLICSDFIKWAKAHDIPVGPGRGSGAGSVIAWALKITDLDPLHFNLLFERFLNPERISMPDFDIDFCQDRRDEVISYVQERYGRDRVAQIITFGKLQARAVVRDVGRVLQMPYGAVDRIAKMIPNNPAAPVTLKEAIEQDEDLRKEAGKDEVTQKLVSIALKLEGLYRHASTHAAGLVIGDRVLHALVPVYRDPRSDMPVTQFNMKYVEQAGLVKFDFLGLKTLTVVQRSVQFIKESTGREIDILQISLDDQNTFEMLTKGDATGVFQLESSGMRDVLRKVKPTRFEDIIALVALYRPGPMDNIPRYIANKNGLEEPDYLHPLLQPILEETYGIMIYQEQVLQAAQILAGYSLGAADLLRKAMGKKIQSVMDAEREKFVKGALEKNQIPEDVSHDIFDQIAKFAGYGFNKAHSTCYALIAYQTAWLKANYPVEFMAASMTLDYGNTDKLSVFKQELDRMGVRLLPPDVNESAVMFRVEEGAVRYALAALKGVGEGAMESLVRERKVHGAYQSLGDFLNRADSKLINKKQFEGLIRAGAFDTLYPNRAELYTHMELLLRHAQTQAEERESGQVNLFAGADDEKEGDGLPPLKPVEPWDLLTRLGHEFDAVGFYLSAHPLDERAGQLEGQGVVAFMELENELKRRPSSRVKMAGVLIKKQERVSAKSGNKYAFLQCSDSSGVFEVMIFSDTLACARDMLEPGTALLLSIDAEKKDGQIRLTGRDIKPLDEAMSSSLRKIDIYLDAPAPASKIKDLMDTNLKGAVEIKLHAQTANGNIAEIDLPGRWQVGTDFLRDLRRTAGIIKIDEG